MARGSSPVTSDLIVSQTIGLGGPLLDGADLYWLESRPTEGGRNVVVKYGPDGGNVDVNPAPFNARTRVHEYGGGAVIVKDGALIFSNYADQRLYRAAPGSTPQPITAAGSLRYADGVVDEAHAGDGGRLICVREDHGEAALASNHGDAVNTIAAVSLADGSQEVLVAGNDFYASPRLSPDGAQLAWLTWNHPNMPWDGCELWVADVNATGSLFNARLIAGGVEESIFGPVWSPDGVLTFISDRTGWWNLYRWETSADGDHQVRALAEMAAEFGRPQWVFGITTYAYVSPSRLVCSYTQEGIDRLAYLDVANGSLTEIATPYTSIGGVVADGRRIAFKGGAPTLVGAIVEIEIATGEMSILKRAATLNVDRGYLSVPESLTFPSGDDREAYGLFYPPANQDFEAPEGEKPPLLVISHGGPTGATSSSLSLGIQFWTSRGFAVLDVNYGGSTGYGRAYRNLLRGQWGIVDVDDCVNGALYLVHQGKVDGERLAIRGGSAGGYTTLSALTFRHVFHAGASHYGVSDLEALARDTHKFESRYLDRLIGPYPQRLDLYTERSPIHHLERPRYSPHLLPGSGG